MPTSTSHNVPRFWDLTFPCASKYQNLQIADFKCWRLWDNRQALRYFSCRVVLHTLAAFRLFSIDQMVNLPSRWNNNTSIGGSKSPVCRWSVHWFLLTIFQVQVCVAPLTKIARFTSYWTRRTAVTVIKCWAVWNRLTSEDLWERLLPAYCSRSCGQA